MFSVGPKLRYPTVQLAAHTGQGCGQDEPASQNEPAITNALATMCVEYAHGRKGLALQATRSRQNDLAGLARAQKSQSSSCMMFAIEAKSQVFHYSYCERRIKKHYNTGYLSFYHMAQCAVHALKGLAQPRVWSEALSTACSARQAS